MPTIRAIHPPMEGEVHVWHAVLDEVTAPPEMAPLLSSEERARAERFRFARDRRNYIAAHGVLRTILGRYMNVNPSAIPIHEGPYGKPGIDESMNPGSITFNISGSNGHALYAISSQSEVGVDIEPIRAIPEMTGIVQRFFSPAEQEEFAEIPPEQRDEAFFSGWTRKEAVIKALGLGLTLPLDRFDVSLAPAQPARILMLDPKLGDASQWTLIHVSPASGFAAAVAIQHQAPVMSLREWPED